MLFCALLLGANEQEIKDDKDENNGQKSHE
jgi:hypothetical protein